MSSKLTLEGKTQTEKSRKNVKEYFGVSIFLVGKSMEVGASTLLKEFVETVVLLCTFQLRKSA